MNTALMFGYYISLTDTKPRKGLGDGGAIPLALGRESKMIKKDLLVWMLKEGAGVLAKVYTRGDASYYACGIEQSRFMASIYHTACVETIESGGILCTQRYTVL